MTRSTYERLIKNNSKLSITNFTYMLAHLHLNFEEFMLFSEDQQYLDKKDYQRLANQVEQAILLRDLTQLKTLQRTIVDNHDLSLESNYTYRYLLIIVKLNISHYQHLPFNQSDLTIIYNYLMKRTIWHSYELFIFKNIWFIFKPTVLRTILPRIIRRLNCYYENLATQKECVQIILRLITVCILKKELAGANYLLNKLTTTNQIWNNNCQLTLENITLAFLKNIIIWITSKQTQAIKNNVTVIIDTLKQFEDKTYQITFQGILKQVTELYAL